MAFKRILKEPLAVPDVCVNVAVVPYVVPSLETSNPVGAVAIRSADNVEPDMLNACDEEAVPYVVVKAAVVADPMIVGEAEAGVTLAQVVPIFNSSISTNGVVVAAACLKKN